MMKRFLFAATIAFLLIGSAHATQLPYPSVSSSIDTQLPTNQSNAISAAALRSVLHNIVDSVPVIGALYPGTNSASTYAYQTLDQASSYTFTASGPAITLQKPVVLPTTATQIARGWWAIITAGPGATPIVTPTGATINGNSSLTIAPGTSQIISTDGINYFALSLGSSGGGGLGSFPTAVSGAVTSGGIPYFNSAIQMSSSGALAANALVVGGGAGGAPATATTGAGVLTAIGQTVTGSGGMVLAASPTIAAPTLTNPIITGSLTATGLVTNADLVSPTVTVNTIPCTLGASCTISAAASLVVGSSTITSGTNGDIEFNNSGVLGEKGVTGSGLVVEATSPTLTSPALGTPTALTLTNATGLPISGITGLGTGVGSSLALSTTTNISGSIPLQGTGGRVYSNTIITNSYNVLASDYFVVATSSSGVPTFPTAAGITGQAYVFKNNSGSSITPATTSSQTIDGSAPAALANHGTLKIFSDGTGNWSSW